MGRDHTIYATESGYVKYYKDPEKNPKRQYIGVTFERDMVLPLPRNCMRRRRLNMTAHKMEVPPTVIPIEGLEPVPEVVVKGERKGEEGRKLSIGSGYMYRESNWEIGRAAERAKIRVKEFKPRDRWAARTKTWKRKMANREKRVVKSVKKKKPVKKIQA
jgi:large subunit ribosomal protein L27